MESLLNILPVLIIIGCLAKLILFFNFKSKRDKLPFLVHYPYPVIILTEDKTKQRIKKIQNSISQIILLIGALYGVLFFITRQQ